MSCLRPDIFLYNATVMNLFSSTFQCTFKYDSSYWTSATTYSTVEEVDLDNDEEGKFHVFNEMNFG